MEQLHFKDEGLKIDWIGLNYGVRHNHSFVQLILF